MGRKQTIFELQTVRGFLFIEVYGMYEAGISPAPFSLAVDELYDIRWDGDTYTCKAQDFSSMISGAVALGNLTAFGGQGNMEPFIIGFTNQGVSFFSNENKESHDIGIERILNGIILQDRNGGETVYEDIETLSVNNTEGGIDTFTRGIAVEDVPISLDFSDGDQIVTAEDGYLVKSAIIEKPETLIPDNIRIGQNIAGIDGSFIGEAEETEVDLNMVNGDMVITPSENKLLSSVTVKKPETLTQENIALGVEIAGIVGTHEGSGGGISDERLKHFLLSFENFGIVTYKPFYDKIYAETGSYDVEVPDELNGLPVYMQSNGVTGNGFFSNNHVKNIIIGENVKWVNDSMNYAFANCNNFNSPVNIPNGVTAMWGTFTYCLRFNQPITIPNSVTQLYSTFRSCYNFNQPITIPNGVTRTDYLFDYCMNFNQPITIPDNVTTAAYMFNRATNMNSPVVIGNSVINAFRMFWTAYDFNATVQFGVSVNDLGYTFDSCNRFNQPLTIPNTAINFMNTFHNCTNLNRPITIYPSANINTMNNAFFNCRNFNQPINIPRNVTYLVNTFRNCTNMNANITVYAKNINNVCGFLYGKNSSKRINIFIPPNCNTNTAFFTTGTNSIVNSTISWTNNTSNQCRYNTSRNIYIYYTVNDEETGA